MAVSQGWKKERIIRRLEGSDSYIISIHYGDSPHCWKKVNNILDEVVDKELGFSESGIRNPQSTKVVTTVPVKYGSDYLCVLFAGVHVYCR